MNRKTRSKINGKIRTRRACKYNKNKKISRKCKRSFPKRSLRKTNSNRFRYSSTRKQNKLLNGGALCPDSDDEYDIGGPNKKDNIIASSSFYIYKDTNIPTVAIKEVPVSRWLPKEKIQKEFEYAKLAGELKIGPTVHYTTFCEINDKQVGYMVMDLIDGRTLQGSDKDNQEIVDEINELFKKMAENNMYQDEVHSLNVMIGKTQEDETDRVYFIDFGDILDMNDRQPKTVEDIVIIE
jgi:hypothetical protein